MQLALSSSAEAGEYLRTQNGIIIPIGSVEQHGPIGAIGTDHLTSEFVARGVGDRIGAMVAPTLAYGMSQHHLSFPGSATLRPSTLMAVICDVVESLAVHGFRRFFFINGHGGNVASGAAAFSELYARRSLGEASSAPRCRMLFWGSGPRTQALVKELYGDTEGSHATCSEVSLTQFCQPTTLRKAEMSPPVAPKSEGFFEAADYRARFPDGRIGSAPWKSSPQDGGRIYETAVADMIEAYQTFLVY
jgi:creatinine amidohydrolase